MSPLSVEFGYFFPVVFALYWLARGRASLQNAVALAASYVFFASWTPSLVWVLAASTAADYFLGPLLAPSADSGADSRRRAALAVSLFVNLGFLGFFKYEAFFADGLNQVLAAAGVPAVVPVAKVLAPIGLSFWTLQKLGYVFDVYHGRVAPSRSALAFAAWVAFFPQLLAGPIARARDVLPQFEAGRRPSAPQWMSGAANFLLGFLMKSYVASVLAAALADPVFADPTSFGRSAHWASLLGYAAQIFCDFAGYSLIAIGLGKLLGIELPINFNYPFVSRSLPEFWRRWHISLNAWLFDYIFVPVTAGRGPLRNNLPAGFLLVFLVSGLWHGARWTFVAWGALQGLGLCVHYAWDEWYKRLCRRDRAWVARRRSASYQAAAWVVTQAFFVLTLVPFRAPSMAAAATFWRGLLHATGDATVNLRSGQLLLCAAFLVLYHWSALRPGGALLRRAQVLPAPVRGLAFGVVVVFLMLFAPVGSGTFIYAQF